MVERKEFIYEFLIKSSDLQVSEEYGTGLMKDQKL